MHNLIEIDNQPSMARDMNSHAVILTSSQKIHEYKARKNAMDERVKESNFQQEQIDMLKNDISEIKSMLAELLQR